MTIQTMQIPIQKKNRKSKRNMRAFGTKSNQPENVHNMFPTVQYGSQNQENSNL